MRVLVTGASGFIGGNFARSAAERGAQVTALVRDERRAAHLAKQGIRLVPGDLGDVSALAMACRAADAIVHLAGTVTATRDLDFFHTNAIGTLRLAEAAARQPHPPRFVYCSSLSAGGPCAPHAPLTEGDAARPVSRYGQSKLAGELAVRALSAKLSAAIVRPPIVYGHGDRQFLPLLVRMVRSRLVLLPGRGILGTYSLVHVDDLCRALWVLASRPSVHLCDEDQAAGLFYVADGTPYQIPDIAAQLAQHLRMPAPKTVRAPWAAVTSAAALTGLMARLGGPAATLTYDKVRELRHPYWLCHGKQAETVLNYTPGVDLATGLRSALDTDPNLRSLAGRS